MTLNELVAVLRTAATTCQPCEPLSLMADDDPTVENAYKVQIINHQYAETQGKKVIGRKIGLTSKAVQRQLGVEQPDFGVLFSDMAFGSGDEVSFKTLIQPKVETEICLVLEKDLLKEKHNVNDLIKATAYALPAIEIVDSRIKDWKITIFDTIADNASSAFFVMGTTPVPLSKLDLELCGMVMFRKGEPVSTGAGLACLGNPLNAAVWLADKMVEIGTPLKAGDLILTGALGPMVSVQAGDSITAKVSGLGNVSLHITD